MLEYSIKKLANNVTVFIVNTKKLSSLDITLYIKVGSVYENEKNNGISHLLEHLLFLKTKRPNLHPVALDIYPYTRKDFTYFEITTHKKLAREALSALLPVILSPSFTKANLKNIKKIVAEEMSDFYDDPNYILNQEIDRFLYKKTSLAFSVAGNKKSINNITIKDLKEWYKKYYAPSNMILTLIGDIDVSKTIKQINNAFHFQKSQSETKKITDQIVYPKINTQPIKLRKTNFQKSYLAFVFPVSGVNGPNYIYYVFLAEILNRKIRQKLENSGLFYDIQLYFHCYLNAGEFRVITACDKSNVNKIIKEFNTLYNAIKISNPYFRDMKDYIKCQFLLKKDNVDELSSLSLYLLAGNPKIITLDDEIRKIESINLDKIKKIKNKIFNVKNCYTFIMN